MYIDKNGAQLTDEDMKGLSLREVEPESKDRARDEIVYGAKLGKAIIVCAICSGISTASYIFKENKYLIIIAIAFMFIAMILLMCATKKSNKINNKRFLKVDVRVHGKYEAERYIGNTKYFPLDVSDISSGYRTKVYVPVKQYYSVKEGDVASITILL